MCGVRVLAVCCRSFVCVCASFYLLFVCLFVCWARRMRLANITQKEIYQQNTNNKLKVISKFLKLSVVLFKVFLVFFTDLRAYKHTLTPPNHDRIMKYIPRNTEQKP